MSYTYWKIKTQDDFTVKKLSETLECSEIVSRLLINRGLIDAHKAKDFLYPKANINHDPFLLTDMHEAVNRIITAINNKERILIYGDYDVDGITSVSALYLYLKNFTDDIEYYIPDRFSQGYGINNAALDRIKSNGCSLIITVDTGVSAINEIKYAKEIGLDVVITDHHECQETLPDAIAVVNPKRRDSDYPFSKLAGVGVVYKLISAIDFQMGTSYSDDNIDLVAIGTVADIMPLIDENRLIVKNGLDKITNNPNSGLKELISLALSNNKISAASIGFAIAPRINAAGRLAEAEVGVELFTTSNSSKAVEIAQKLCELNVERQKIETQIFEEASEIIENCELDKKYNALVLWKEGWHSGVIGIVASKLKEKYNKPVILFSVDKVSKGSGRSVAPFNLYEAFEKCGDILIQYGGHKYAAGLLIENENLYKFRDALSNLVGEYTKEHELTKNIDIECTLNGKQLNYKLAEEIALLQPYGKSNEIPLFCIRNVKINDIIPTSNNKHLRLKFDISDKMITGFYFGKTAIDFDYRQNDLVDIVCEVNSNEYKSIKSIQLIVRDIRLNENQLNINQKRRIFCDNASDLLKIMLPNRSDISYVYKYFKKSFSNGKNTFNLDTVPGLINKDCLTDISYEKAYFSIKILLELGVITGFLDDISLNLTGITTDKKFTLTDSTLLMSIYDKVGVKFGN